MTEGVRKRLATLKEFSDLGAGFKIAALDLELRGAGNLPGGEQHGHINAIGFDMYVRYVRMLEDKMRELRGEEVAPETFNQRRLEEPARADNRALGGRVRIFCKAAS